MKTILFYAFTIIGAHAAAQSKCVNFSGEYVGRVCPKLGTSYTSVKIIQTDCNSIGFQKLYHGSNHSYIQYHPVQWEVVGGYRKLVREDAISADYNERFFDESSLVLYQYRHDKSTSRTELFNTQILSKLPNGYLNSTYFSAGFTGTMMPKSLCP